MDSIARLPEFCAQAARASPQFDCCPRSQSNQPRAMAIVPESASLEFVCGLRGRNEVNIFEQSFKQASHHTCSDHSLVPSGHPTVTSISTASTTVEWNRMACQLPVPPGMETATMGSSLRTSWSPRLLCKTAPSAEMREGMVAVGALYDLPTMVARESFHCGSSSFDKHHISHHNNTADSPNTGTILEGCSKDHLKGIGTSSSCYASAPLDSGLGESMERRLRSQERNRIAAMKSRQRKKKEWERLIETEKLLREENGRLRDELVVLRQELARLMEPHV